MKRFIINLILIPAFLLLVAAVTLMFAADTWFNAAKKLDEAYRWKKAENAFKAAVKLDPYNAVYLAGYGQFLFKQSLYYKDKIALLDEAAELYGRALKFNPRCAEYYLRSGEIEIDRYLLKGATDLSFPRKPALPAGRRDDPGLSFPRKRESILKSGDSLKSIDEAMADFRWAIECDPNGFNTAYEVGYYGLKVWDHLSDIDKEMVLNRLRYALEVRPWHGQYIFPELWKCVKEPGILFRVTPETYDAAKCLYYFMQKNNLWQFRKDVMARLEISKKREKPDEFAKETDDKMRLLRSLRSLAMTGTNTGWIGKSLDGKHDIINGMMYWNGTVNKGLETSPGRSAISIELKKYMAIKSSNPGLHKYDPYVVVELDGKVIGEMFVNNLDWQEYSFDVDADGGLHILSVSFINDIYLPDKDEDRNLYVGEVRINER